MLKLIRFPNLIIVALTQYLLQYLVIVPAAQQAGISVALDDVHFAWFVLTTVIIAAGGYIVNDILDYEIDLINKPEKLIINRLISEKNAWRLYRLLNIGGLIIALYLAIYVGNLPLVLIFPAAVGLLWLYSRYFKKAFLTGNFIVAIFCAFVAGVVLFAERHTFSNMQEVAPEIAQKVGLIFGTYGLYAFFSTLFREIVKDIEDVKGDETADSRTLPLVAGIPTAKIVAGATGVGLLGLLGLIFPLLTTLSLQLFAVLALLLPILIALLLLLKAQTTQDFHRLSQFSKVIMLLGLGLLLLIA